MPSFDTRDILLAVRADGNLGDTRATTISGWSDISEWVKGVVNINLTGSTYRLEPGGDNTWGGIRAGTKSGTISIELVRNSGATNTDDGVEFFEQLFDTAGRKFDWLIQPRRTPLIAGTVVTPDASVGNPQYQGSAVMSNISPWGPGGEATAQCSVTADLDDNYKRFTS